MTALQVTLAIVIGTATLWLCMSLWEIRCARRDDREAERDFAKRAWEKSEGGF
jgi:uncharacterized membrane protein YuzA (DUF378 family)